MKKALIAYISTLLVVLVLDALWLGVLMGPTYKQMLGSLMRDKPLLAPAAVFYLLYALGVVVLAVWPGVTAGSVWRGLGYGAMLGLIAYGTYDLSNWATLVGWPPLLVFIDIFWGVVLTALAAAVGVWAANR
ncbi:MULTISPECIES: DUF2177 family protein [Pseudomonas]|uniref:DUF2177 family protein n=1 Tax=Pseudomonas eucalypticola TaxID=2599595 RepID=A0A7D5H5Z7_9PSED|nr:MULTISPECIES: DUF2177 family protein [Pseudomonas]QKZ06462.1 DUF2177 family protein [Pseudomonas eucalypticola]